MIVPMDAEEKREVLGFLKNIGVDTRFVSVVRGEVLINNLRFSRFSRKREGVFTDKFPEIGVLRSKVFQKICSRSSRVLGSSLSPKIRVFIDAEGVMAGALYAVLEPYTRKYGIRITDVEYDIRARPETLDHTVSSAIRDMVEGKIIENKFRSTEKCLYPFSAVPGEWIESWLDVEIKITRDPLIQGFIEFFEQNVPQFRENMLKSLDYLEEKN